MDMNEVVRMAVQQSLKANSKEIDSGEYVLDGTRVIVDLKGKLVKGDAEWHSPTTSIPTIAALALAMRLMGVQRERFLESLEVAMGAALAMDEKAEAYVQEFNEDYAAIEGKIRASMRAQPPRRHEGKVYAKGVKMDVVINAGPALVAAATVAVPTT